MKHKSVISISIEKAISNRTIETGLNLVGYTALRMGISYNKMIK
jgi:hypothetical protein